MKKYLIYLAVFFSLFIGIEKAKALIILEDENYISSYAVASYKRKIELNNNVLSFSGEYKDSGQSTYRTINVTYNLTYDNFYIQCFRGYYSGAFILLIESNNNIYADTSYSPARIKASSPYKITYIELDKNRTSTLSDSFIQYNSQTSYGQFRLSNQDIYNTNNELFFQKNIITNYTFSNTINCKNISKIKVNFDIPTNQSFPIDLDFMLQYYQDTIPQPVIALTDNVNNTNVNLAEQIFSKTEIGSPSLQYIYSGTYSADIEPVNSLSIVIDVTEYNNEIYLLFSSQYNYSIEYITISQVESYFETINMNDKYAIYLIPKTLNQDISEAIYLNGIYNIEIRKFYNSNTNEYTILDSISNYKEKYLDKIYSITDLNYLIYIQNPNQYTENQNSYIKFDTRYYSYQIKENEYTQIEIVNPNTNETIKPNPIDTIENSDTNKKNFLSDILDKFRNSSYLKNLLNNEFVILIGSKLGKYIMLLFTISIVAIYIRMIKK